MHLSFQKSQIDCASVNECTVLKNEQKRLIFIAAKLKDICHVGLFVYLFAASPPKYSRWLTISKETKLKAPPLWPVTCPKANQSGLCIFL